MMCTHIRSAFNLCANGSLARQILTTYGTAANTAEQLAGEKKWMVVIDEAQTIKNQTTKTWREVFLMMCTPYSRCF